MEDKILIKEFLKDKNVGAVASSSKSIVKKIISEIDFKKANVIVEYGPGKGTITKQLLKKMKPDASLFVFETNNDFINHLNNINDMRLVIINTDAKNALLILRHKYKIEDVDYIISTIPFTFLDQRLKRRIIFSSYTMLKENGKFLTYQYTPLIYSIIKNKFKNHSIIPNLTNFPPAFIMKGVK
jgi:phospholipid N-methyltransferase